MTAPTPSTPQLAEFREETWHDVRVRWVCALMAIGNLAWGLLCPLFVADAYDPLYQRIVISIGMLAVVTLTFVAPLKRVLTERLFYTVCYALTLHIFFLIRANHFTPIYTFGGFVVMFCAGPVLLNLRVVRFYYAFAFVMNGALYLEAKDANSFMLFVATITSSAVSLASLHTLLFLIGQLRISKGIIESKSESLDLMINSLGQGFFSFGPDGLVHDTCSKACGDILGETPAGRSFWDVIGATPTQATQWQSLLQDAVTIEPARNLFLSGLPKTLANSKDRHIGLQYYQSVDENDVLKQIVVVATDQTTLIRAERAAESERKNSRMIATLVKNKRSFNMFYKSLREGIAKFSGLSNVASEDVHVQDYKRFLHTIKGAFGLFNMDEFAAAIHDYESEWKNDANATESYDVRIHRQVAGVAERLAKFQMSFQEILPSEIRAERQIEIGLNYFVDLRSEPLFLEAPRALQEQLLEPALQSIDVYFQPYSDLVVRAAKSQGKKLSPIAMKNGDLRVLPEAYAELFPNLVHVFRNAVDHGLESPTDREAAGKNASGLMRVVFGEDVGEDVVEHKKRLCIEIFDDGRGIDPQIVRKKLAQTDAERAERLNDVEILQVIFDPEFSTKDSVSLTSGRGVGLNAVLEAVQNLGGRIDVESTVGIGTRFKIVVPFVEPIEFFGRIARAA